jgi:hypothetical protein
MKLEAFICISSAYCYTRHIFFFLTRPAKIASLFFTFESDENFFEVNFFERKVEKMSWNWTSELLKSELWNGIDNLRVGVSVLTCCANKLSCTFADGTSVWRSLYSKIKSLWKWRRGHFKRDLTCLVHRISYLQQVSS